MARSVLVTPQALRTAESNNMTSVEREDLSSYAEKLRRYSLEDLEDIYFNIHILRHPLKYRLVRMELERRNVVIETEERPAVTRGNLTTYLAKSRLLASHP